MAAIPNQLSFLEKAKLFFFRDGTATLARVLIGAVLGALIGYGAGPFTALAVGVVGLTLVGLTGLSQFGVENAKKQVLTDLYRDEIAATLGKTPQQVTVDDLVPMSQTPEEGGKGSYAIKAALDNYQRTRNYNILFQGITAVLMTTGLSVASALAPEMSVLVLAGASSLLYNELFDSVRTGGEIWYDLNKGTITRDIRAIGDQIGLGGRISSTRVFGVYVKADPKLAEAIRQRCGDGYEALNITVKRELVRDYDPQYQIYQVTQDINLGHTSPTELGFLAYGQHSGVPRRETALVPFKGIDDEGQEMCAEENGHVVCRGTSPASMVPDGTYENPSLLDKAKGESRPSPLDTPSTQPAAIYDPRELFHVERLRESRLKDPFRAV